MNQLDARAEAVREFNRYYTSRIGVLGDAHLGSAFSLTEARVLYELAHRDRPSAAEIGHTLGLDAGYLSRTLRSFKKRGLIVARPSPQDKRRSLLSLTAAGRKAFAPLDKKARALAGDLIAPLGTAQQRRLLEAMRVIRASLGDESPAPSYSIRLHRPGDMGWIVHRHGLLYSQEYGWDERFEALVAGVVSEFIKNFDSRLERCWIAERDGDILGSIFVVKKSKTVAQLRLLYVEPTARGLGIGARLVDEVIAFAQRAGYRKIVLWTQSDLKSARKIYKAKGFEMVGTEGHEMFGSPLTAESWEKRLT